MKAASLIWNGTPEEFIELASIADLACKNGGIPCTQARRCPSHSILIDTQRGLDDLLFMRRIRERLLQKEFSKP